jgi:histidine triad (HIT) family protein
MITCTFCQLVSRQLKCYVVHETDSALFILPEDMVVFGHTLVLPKDHFENLFDIPEDLLSIIIMETKRLAVHYQSSLHADGINILHASGVAAQQSVFHFHMHIFPRFFNDNIDAWPNLPKQPFNPNEVLERLRFK